MGVIILLMLFCMYKHIGLEKQEKSVITVCLLMLAKVEIQNQGNFFTTLFWAIPWALHEASCHGKGIL